jgi:hypothetical protein
MILITLIDAPAMRENFLVRKPAIGHQIYFSARAFEMILFFAAARMAACRARTQKREQIAPVAR